MIQKMYFITLLFCAYTFSQTPVTKTLGEFSKLKVYDLINVDIIKSDKDKIEITGNNAQDVQIIQKNNTLKLRMKLDKMFKGEDINIKLYYTSIDEIDANEGAEVLVKDKIKQYEITLKAQEGARIAANINTKNLVVKCITGGRVSTLGQTENQNITLRTGGVYEGSQTKTQNSYVSIKTGGEASVHSENLLDVKIFSGGDVLVYGTPKQLKQNKLFGGRIYFKD